MNPKVLFHIITILVTTSLMAHYDLSGDALTNQVEGDVRHGLREYLDHTAKAGFLVDVLWNLTHTHTLILNAIHGAMAAQTAPTPGATA